MKQEHRCMYSQKILEMLTPELAYPKWEKWKIKRKYGKHFAVEIDVWIPYMPTIFSLLPKYRWRNKNKPNNYAVYFTKHDETTK